MITQDIINIFLKAPTEERLTMMWDDESVVSLKKYLGQAAFDEYRRLARRLDTTHLGVQAPKNLIFVPGITGSLLESKTKGGVWWIDVRTRHHINDLQLSPNGWQDANPNNQIAPFNVDCSYEPFLTAALNRDEFGHEVFPYDWRKSLLLSTTALRDLILRLHNENGNRPIHLVGHSMGGLLIRATLMNHGEDLWPKLGRIVFIGTPHYGSPTIAGYLKNHLWGFELIAILGLYLSRETFRSLWGALSLLPAPQGIYPGTRPNDLALWRTENGDDSYSHPCTNFDLYQAENWKLELTPSQTQDLQQVLDATAEFYWKLDEAHKVMDQDLRDRMLVIAGVGYQSLFRLAYEKQFFGLWERTAKVTERIQGDPHREGDGRVPLASAMLENIPIHYVRGVHSGLANIPAVYNDVFRWLNEEHPQLPDNVYEALSSHLAPADAESEAPHLDGTAMTKSFTDDPGLWDLTEPDLTHLDEMRRKLEADQLQEFSRVRLL